MPDNDNATVSIRFRGKETDKALPRALRPSSRGVGDAPDPIEALLTVKVEYDLSRRTRGAPSPVVSTTTTSSQLLSLEAVDGSTIFMRADKLSEVLARVYPDKIRRGEIDLDLLRDRSGQGRGLTDWIWSKLTELDLGADAIIDAAKGQAEAWVKGKLKGAAQEKLDELAAFSFSTWGAKVLMELIESRLGGDPGLYRWSGAGLNPADRVREGDLELGGHFAMLKGGQLHGLMNPSDENLSLFMFGGYD